ncbi:MAG: DUF4145 domain-containing protein [Alphaproteobacteria bacterium]
MPELVADCPRCDAKKHTFDVFALQKIDGLICEAYSVCKNCSKGTIFEMFVHGFSLDSYDYKHQIMDISNSLNNYVCIQGHVNIRNTSCKKPPEHLPENIKKAFIEGSESFSGNCPNAAAAMFRLCVDLATKTLLPTAEAPIEGLNKRVRNYLAPRLEWIFQQGILPKGHLEQMSECIRQDGNDGAHDGTLTQDEAEDLLDFTYLLLEKIYTEPEKFRLANERRQERRIKDSAV